jgi:hypothetical protein
MMGHVVRLTGASLLLVVCMLRPFLPGGYDGFAVALAAMGHAVGTVGLLLVPFGLVWLAHERRRLWREPDRRAGRTTPFNGVEAIDARGRRLALASIAAVTLVMLALSFVATVTMGPSLGLGVLGLWGYLATRLVGRVNATQHAGTRTFNPAPLYLIVVPLVGALILFVAVGPAIDFSRNRVIDHSAGLVRDIERYRETHGHYPVSLQALTQDYRPAVAGVDRYHYEPNGEGYNVFFEHWSGVLGTREIVMYNSRGEHEFASHDSDLLLSPTPDLAKTLGYYAALDAGRPHWKRLLFD